MTSFQISDRELGERFNDLDGATLVGVVLESTYTPAVTVTAADTLAAHEASGTTRLSATGRVEYDNADASLVLFLDGITYGSDATEAISGIAWCRPGGSDATRYFIGFSPMPQNAGPVEPTYPDGLYAFTRKNFTDWTVADVPFVAGNVDASSLATNLADFLSGTTGGGSAVIGDPVEVPRGVATVAPVDSDGKLTSNVFVSTDRVSPDAEGGDTDAFLALPPAADQDPGTIVFLLAADNAPSWGAAEVDDTPTPAKLTGLKAVPAYIGSLYGSGPQTYSFTWEVTVNGVAHTITVSDTYDTDDATELNRLLLDIFDIPGTSFNLTDWIDRGYAGELGVYTTLTGLDATIEVTDSGSGTPAGLATELAALTATDGKVGRIRGVHDGVSGALGSEHYYTLADWDTDGIGTDVFTTHAFAQGKGSIVQAVPADLNGGVAKWSTVAHAPRVTELEFRYEHPSEVAGSPEYDYLWTVLDRLIYFVTQGSGVDLPERGDSVTPWGGGGGGSVATDAIFDAKGDLPVGTGSNTAAKLTVGSNDTILVADSSQTTGLKWAGGSTARTALGLAIGTDVQAHDADLDAIAGLSPSNDDFVQRKSGAWANRTPSQVAADLAPVMQGTFAVPILAKPSGTSGTWSIMAGSNALYVFSSSTANTDYIEWNNIYIAAGTYTVRHLYLQGSTNGKMRLKIDGTSIGSADFDTYAGSGNPTTWEDITGVSIASSGAHTIRLTTPDKNGSSSAYVARLVSITFLRTA